MTVPVLGTISDRRVQNLAARPTTGHGRKCRPANVVTLMSLIFNPVILNVSFLLQYRHRHQLHHL